MTLGVYDLDNDRAYDWRDDAACRAGVDPEIFFPRREDAGGVARYARARKVCGGCWVRAACLEYALNSREDWGMWGGLSPSQRREQRRRAA